MGDQQTRNTKTHLVMAHISFCNLVEYQRVAQSGWACPATTTVLDKRLSSELAMGICSGSCGVHIESIPQ